MVICSSKENCVIWCDGLKEGNTLGKSVTCNKRNSVSSSGKDKVNVSTKKSKKAGAQDEREDQILGYMTELKRNLLPCNIVIKWCEMVYGGVCMKG